MAVILELALIPVGLAVSFAADNFLPPEALELEERQMEAFMDFSNIGAGLILWMIFTAVMFAAWIASIIGLLSLRRWGAWLYLASTILALPIYFMMGFDVRHPIDIVFDDVYRFIPGFVIGLAFFSDAIPKSNSEQGVAPNA
ncbi:hypothetical protein N9873_04430 [Akkermansiaceae bacterium]|nr:hypothetical protein [Akkermansiaceae bacterium]MDB4273460.1 hypothetical protein [Akkermansiaceae bacterium]